MFFQFGEDWKGNSICEKLEKLTCLLQRGKYRKHFQIRRSDHRNRPPAKKGALLFTDSEAGCIAGWPQSPQSPQISLKSWHNAQDLLRYWPRRDFDYSLNAPRGAFPNRWEGKGKLWSSKVPVPKSNNNENKPLKR